MDDSTGSITRSRLRLLASPVIIGAGVFFIYLFSNPTPMVHFDYTFRIADAILHGKLGMIESPPSWLNEMVPLGDRYYSVFPLGSVLSMIPFALLKLFHVIDSLPAGLIAALLASASATFFFLLSGKHDISPQRRVILALFPVLATWTWCNLAYAGSWQLALGFALMGEAGALYFTLINRRPLLAGIFFAIAFGNRTEVLLTAPIFIYFLLRPERDSLAGSEQLPSWREIPKRVLSRALPGLVEQRRALLKFLSVPVALGIATLIYNYARFNSVFDFGYMRIPQVASEASFRHGLFSLYAIPANARAMLWEGWRVLDHSPYVIPYGFGGSIFLSSPFLLLLFRRPARNRTTVIAAWIAVVVLTLLLWLHANPGGWQFSYRYGMILLPWMFLILLETGGKKAAALEVILFVLSVAINAYATYIFLWTNHVQP